METNPTPALALQDYWNIAVRRRWLILGCILFSLAVAGTLCMVLPKSYRSDTLILVEDQKIPETYVKGIVGGSVEERITMIKQQVMSRTLLTEIINEFGLNPEKNNPQALEGVLEELRESIVVKTVTSGRTRTVEAFTISFSYEDPVIAMQVTSRIASRFIEENLRHREQFVEGASEFLDYELRRAKEELEQKEQEIRKFKTQHLGALPEQMEANLRTLDRNQEELSAVQENSQRLMDKLSFVESGITEYTKTGKASAALVATHGEPDLLLRRYRELEDKLSLLTAEYKDTYPDVVLTRQELERIKAQVAAKYGNDTEGGGERVVDPYLQNLNERREELKRELASMKRRQRGLINQRNGYERRVEQAPATEQKLLTLLRDYENMKDNYSALLDKKLNAQIAENLEKRQKGEQFRIIDPAHVPAKPDKPNRMRIMVLGLAAGCGLGFGVAFLLEILSPTFRRPEELEREFGFQVLATIPDFAFLYSQPVARNPSMSAGMKGSTRVQEVALGTKVDHRRPRMWPWRGKLHQSGEWPSEWNLVTKLRPASVVAEQFRVAATQLSLLEAGRNPTIVVMTSSVKGEGKTTTIINLGYTLARDLGKRTLLVDCDLKCPAVHLYVDVPPEPGLADIFRKGIPVQRCIKQPDEMPFWVLPAGSLEQETTELLVERQVTTILTDLRTEFDYILIDAPPILPLADMNVLAGLADVLMVVVRAGFTRQDVVRRALHTLRAPQQPHIILTAAESQTMPYYMYYNYQARGPEKQHA